MAARHLSSYFDQGTLTSHLSVSEHVRDVICRCAQSMYAIKVLQTHGMSDEDLRIIYKAVVLAKIMYASPAWWGFADKQRIEAFVRHGVRLGLYQADDPTPAELSADNDDNLFECISNAPNQLPCL